MPGSFKRSGKLYQLYTSYFSNTFRRNEFSDKIDLTIQLSIYSNVKYRHAFYLKFKDKFFTPLTVLQL